MADRIKHRNHFRYRGGEYLLVTYENGGQMLKRWERGATRCGWSIVEKPTDGMWAAAEAAVARRRSVTDGTPTKGDDPREGT